MSQDRLRGSRSRCWRCVGSAVVLATVMMAHSAMAQQETQQAVVENVRPRARAGINRDGDQAQQPAALSITGLSR